MPTDEQKEIMLSQIGELERSRFTNREGVVVPVIQGGPPEDSRAWGDLPAHMKEDALTIQLNWEGFTSEQEFEVIENVIYDRPPFEWVDGIEPSGGTAPDLSAELRDDELAARVRDYGLEDAATHGERVQAGAEMPATEYRAEFADLMAAIADPPEIGEPSDYQRAIDRAADRANERLHAPVFGKIPER